MMDMAARNVSDPARLAGIETQIAKIAKARHDLLVTAVYWRVNEHVSSSLSQYAGRSCPYATDAPVDLNLCNPRRLPRSSRRWRLVPGPGQIVGAWRDHEVIAVAMPQPSRFADTEIDERNLPSVAPSTAS